MRLYHSDLEKEAKDAGLTVDQLKQKKEADKKAVDEKEAGIKKTLDEHEKELKKEGKSKEEIEAAVEHVFPDKLLDIEDDEDQLSLESVD